MGEKQLLFTKIKPWLPLLFIILIGGWLRFWHLKDNPPSLNWDEVSHGYNAYSIAKTGKDEWGVNFPLIFRAYGDYKLPLYIYLTTIPVSVFGLNPFSVRFISSLSGLLLVVVAFFLAKKLTKSVSASVVAALLTALSPWSLFLSRVAVEANLAAFLFSMAMLFFLNEKYGLMALSFGLSLHTYNSARVLVPLVFVFLLLKFWRLKKIKKMIFPIVIFLAFSVPVIFQFLNKTGEARFFWTNVIDQGAINRIIEKRTDSKLPEAINKLIYNRPVYFVTYSFINYFKHFSPSFLLTSGGSHYQFSQPGDGLIFLTSLPFLIVGFIWLLLKKKWFWLFWFFISFIPSSITKDSPHVLRSILILPLPMVLPAVGFWLTKDWLRGRSKLGGKLFLAVFVASILINFSVWWRNYWQIYQSAYSWAWQYGYQEAVGYVKEHYSQYDKIIFTKKYGEPHEFVLFYWPWEPIFYQQDTRKNWDYHAVWYWVNAFDKFEFVNDWEIRDKLKVREGKILTVTSPGNYIDGGQHLKTIDFLDGIKAFEILSYE